MRSIISPMTFQACSYLRNGILVLPSARNILLSSLWALWVSICLPVCIWVYHLCFSLFHQSGWGLMSMSDSHVFVWLPFHHHFSLSSAVISSSPFPAIIVKVPLLPNTNTQLPSILLLYFFFHYTYYLKLHYLHIYAFGGRRLFIIYLSSLECKFYKGRNLILFNIESVI